MSTLLSLESGVPTLGGLLGKPTRVSLTDSRVNVVTILALLRSAQENRPVTL